MEINREERDGIGIIAPVGRVDSNTARDLEAVLLPAFDGGGKVIVDFSRLTYISSAGLRVLLMAAKQSKAKGAALALAGMSPAVKEVFTISGFAKLFKIYPDAEAAASDLRG
ncbi:STAS domain-containing protein [Rhodoligotrophos defluvii]|uniref:STAS domain-containing protein n=1 Tax=Rhodoligotrophos defluvii TaxID=2561934 RepID=UPI0010C9E4FE|nr:STAS domain-containing protein [Rhodoligotrophos defluvii]